VSVKVYPHTLAIDSGDQTSSYKDQPSRQLQQYLIGITKAADSGFGELALRGRRKYPCHNEKFDLSYHEKMLEDLTSSKASCTSAIAPNRSVV
jgi:hypothetical protein